MRGYRSALNENNIVFEKELTMISDLDTNSGIEAVKYILRMKERPDAVFTANDNSAVAVILELQKAGIQVPGNIAVAGFNNEPMSEIINPNLTTVDYPAREVGEVAAATLISKLNNSGSANLTRIVLEHKLVIRESSLRKNQLT
jgi:LacI family transcriptional regulator